MRRFQLATVLIAVAATLGLSGTGARADDNRLPPHPDASSVSINKRTLLDLYLTSREAARALQRYKDILLLDVRSAEVIAASGAPSFSTLRVPLLVAKPVINRQRRSSAASGPSDLGNEAPEQEINPRLIEEVSAELRRRGLGQNATILVLCAAGVHAGRAADLLAEAGFINVYAIVDGFDGGVDDDKSLGGRGWKSEGLPWHRPRS